jgi:hypothetical protein
MKIVEAYEEEIQENTIKHVKEKKKLFKTWKWK